MSGLEAMIAKMESLLGTKGRPNVVTNWYADRNGSWYRDSAWCQETITWAAYHSGNYDAVCFGKDWAYTVYLAQKYQSEGQWHVDVAGIERGSIVFFDWDGSNSISAIDHVGIVTDVNGRDILTIEGNTADSCARRVRHAEDIAGYGRPVYAPVSPPPAPKPTPKPKPGYKAPPFPKGLRPNSDEPSAKGLQKALKGAGYMSHSVELSANYGPLTQAAVRRFHNANPQYAAFPGDPAIGPLGWAELHREAYAS